MPASITYEGGVANFLSLRGSPAGVGQAVEDLTRPGVNGHAYRKAGRRGAPFVMIGTADCLTAAEAKLILHGVSGVDGLVGKAQGSIVSVVDDFARTWANVVLLEVEPLEERKIAGAVGGLNGISGTVLLVVRFVMQMTQ